jgi:transcriptional regulatory protein RtcR
MPNKNRVVIGMLGTELDAVVGVERWKKWRPTVDICRHKSYPVHRFELLYQPKFKHLAEMVRSDIGSVSPLTEVCLTEMRLPNPWDFGRVYSALYDFADSYKFDLEREEYVVHITTGTHVAQICLFLLTEANYFPAKLVQSAKPSKGKEDEPGILKEVDLDLSKYDLIAQRFQLEENIGISFLKSGIDTLNLRFNDLVNEIERVANASSHPILLFGPTGAGKSSLAKRIHQLKKDKKKLTGEFVDVNCATLRGDTVISALFGHTKGAYTDAKEAHPGHLLMADKGVLFLDEIGELSLEVQAMLLQALEEKSFWPLKGTKKVHSDFQLIAGTNCDLEARIREGKFRDDLYARIKLWTFRLPGLAERPEDIAPNLDYEIREYSRLNQTRITINKEARDKFLAFATAPGALWRGNFRDLNAAVVRMATFAPRGRITVENVAGEIQRLRQEWGAAAQGECGGLVERVLDSDQASQIDRFDRVQLEEVLRVCGKSRTRSEAGRRLFNVSREQKSTSNDADRLSKYLRRFGLDWDTVRASLLRSIE